MNKILISDTTFRDGQQSLMATRLSTKEILPIIEKMDKLNFYAFEVWGGATFDACLRYLNEDPWERLRNIRSICKNTKLQMLLRGQNILGYRNYSDNIVENFIYKAAENGIDIFRVFDALNDLRNLESSVRAVKKCGKHVQLSIAYTISPVHTIDYFVDLAKKMEDMGSDSICIKDMAGLLLPNVAYELINEIKENVKLPIQVHSHYTSGLAGMTYMKAIEAGANIVDTSFSPLAMGTSQPSTEVIVAALEGSEYDTGIDLNKLVEITDMIKPIRERAIESGLISTKVLGVDIQTLLYQVPGGMLSNLISQLKAQNAENRFEEVLREVPRVREDFGYPPLVTPSSQIVGSQAVLNVISGERYKFMPKESRDLVRGMYGRTPVKIKDEIIKLFQVSDEELIECRPSDLIHDKLEDYRSEIKKYIEKDEDIISYALFKDIALEYFKFRNAQKYGVDENLYINNAYPL